MLRKVKFQPQALKIIETGFKKEMLSQSLLFVGEVGSGKSTLALHVAGIMHCKSENKPCGVCENCIKITNFTHPDVIFINTDDAAEKLSSLQNIINTYGINQELTGETVFVLRDILFRYQSEFLNNAGSKNKKKKTELDNLAESIQEYVLFNISDQSNPKTLSDAIKAGIKLAEQINNENIPAESIRSLMQRLNKSSFSGKLTLIISGIDKMRSEGANAFLKTLEEPAIHSRIILMTNKPEIILPTIKSRCFIVPFNRLNNESVQSIVHENWKIRTDNISEFGGLLTRIGNTQQNHILELFEQIFPSFTKQFHLFVDKIIKTDGFDRFVKELTYYMQTTENIKVLERLERISIINKMKFQKQVDTLVLSTKTNNADKRLVLETLISSLYELWRQK